MYQKVTSVILSLFVISVAGWAQQDPWVGTWKQNLAKSKYDPGPPPKGPTTVKREAAPGGALKTTTDGMDAQGRPTHTEYTAKPDGMDYPLTGSPSFDTAAVKMPDARTRLLINKKSGQVVRMLRGSLSADGKTITNASITVDPAGKVSHDVTVFEKQ